MIDQVSNREFFQRQAEVLNADFARAARLCHPDWETAGRISCRPPAGDWIPWRDAVLFPIVLPAFIAACDAFGRGHRKELLACDAQLEAALPQAIAEASRRAGKRLAAEHTVPNGEKLWLHYHDRVLNGETPGHFAVMLAVRASAFHLPRAMAVTVLLTLEARGAFPDAPPKVWEELIAEAQPRDQGTVLRAA